MENGTLSPNQQGKYKKFSDFLREEMNTLKAMFTTSAIINDEGEKKIVTIWTNEHAKEQYALWEKQYQEQLKLERKSKNETDRKA